MKRCKLCLNCSTRPGVYFNEEGICGACLYETRDKDKIDWKARDRELWNICEEARGKGKKYDCVIGVSGGKDSTFQAIYARDVLKLHVLLVNSEPDGLSLVGSKNIENLIQQGFDIIKLRPNPVHQKKMMRYDFFKHLNYIRACEMCLYASAFIIADKFDIPLVIEGEHFNLTHGTKTNGVEDGGSCMGVMGWNTLTTPLMEYAVECDIPLRDLFLYGFDAESLKKKDTKGIFLNYYCREWGAFHNLEFSKKRGLKTRKDVMEFSPYDYGTPYDFFQMDGPEWFVAVNQYLKFVKFGFGQATDHTSYAIREGKIKRDVAEGTNLLEEYDGKIAPRFIREFCDYIGITLSEFWNTVEGWNEKHTT